jgi:hypothetical protein
MMESASVVCRLYGLWTESVRWQNETGSWPGPSVVVGWLSGVGAAVVVSSTVEVVVDAAVVVVAWALVVDGSVVVVVCALALTLPSHKTKSAPVAIPTAMARRTRASYG